MLSTPRLGIILLLVVLGHLGFMVSPLHTPAGHSVDVVGSEPWSTHSEGPDEASPRSAVAGPLVDPDHCALIWSSPGKPSTEFGQERSVPRPLLLDLGVSAAACSLAHVIGPPPRADRQALLQVFRE